MKQANRQLRIGYVPYNPSLTSPADLRRFVAYAKSRQIQFEIANPSEKYDVVVLSEAADITVWCDYPYGKIIYDLVDSYLAIPRSNLRQWLQGTAAYVAGRHRRFRFDYWKSVQNMCKRADAVICSTEEQRADIVPYCRNVHIILDWHSPLITKVKTEYTLGSPIKLVWEGLPNNLGQLSLLKDVLHHIDKRNPIHLCLVTDESYPRFLGRFGKINSLKQVQTFFPKVSLYPWEAGTFAEQVSACDIALIPIDHNNALFAGKPANKLLLLWRLGMPVITSATPAYERAMLGAGISDFTCVTQDDWIKAIDTLIENASMRRETAAKGRTYAERSSKEEVLFAQWDRLFLSLLDSGSAI